MKMACAHWLLAGVALLLAGVSILPGQTSKGGAKDPAVERARKQTKMLDDLYKTAIVLITEHYVHKDSDPPAAVAGKLLWKAMKEKGHHDVRLLDATGEPIESANSPQDDFEKSAIKEILGGKASVDEVVEKDGKKYLRTATSVPVVMDKCVMCHPNYKSVPKGKAIGAIAYTLLVE